jgi:hypothetical protein
MDVISTDTFTLDATPFVATELAGVKGDIPNKSIGVMKSRALHPL